VAKGFIGVLLAVILASLVVAANTAGEVNSKYFLQIATLCTLIFMIPPLLIAQIFGFALSWKGHVKFSCTCSLCLMIWPAFAIMRDSYFPVGGFGSGYQIILYGFIFLLGIASLTITFLAQLLGKLAMKSKERL
jgi:hypothetical protein